MPDDRVQQLVDVEEIKQLKGRYFRYLDTQDWTAWTNVFTEDLHVEGDGAVHDGREEFVSFIAQNLAGGSSVHHGYTPEITITGPDTATGIWALTDYVVLPGEGPPVGFRGYGHYREEYVRTTQGWRIKRVVITRLRIDPLEGGLPVISGTDFSA